MAGQWTWGTTDQGASATSVARRMLNHPFLKVGKFMPKITRRR
jgi:hypothetical protein